jgi:hypothetical protein
MEGCWLGADEGVLKGGLASISLSNKSNAEGGTSFTTIEGAKSAGMKVKYMAVMSIASNGAGEAVG